MASAVAEELKGWLTKDKKGGGRTFTTSETKRRRAGADTRRGSDGRAAVSARDDDAAGARPRIGGDAAVPRPRIVSSEPSTGRRATGLAGEATDPSPPRPRRRRTSQTRPDAVARAGTSASRTSRPTTWPSAPRRAAVERCLRAPRGAGVVLTIPSKLFARNSRGYIKPDAGAKKTSSPELALCYYKNASAAEPRGWMFLKDVQAVREAGPKCFVVEHPSRSYLAPSGPGFVCRQEDMPTPQDSKSKTYGRKRKDARAGTSSTRRPRPSTRAGSRG